VESPAAEIKRLAEEAERAFAGGVDRARAWLATPEGRRFRQNAARVLIVASPLILRMRFLRATPFGRLIEIAGGAAILIKVAEALRDWEPTPAA
jgi:hypothetical protein